jgi:hypothetical protein
MRWFHVSWMARGVGRYRDRADVERRFACEQKARKINGWV